MVSKALVLLSGGQDSATCLAYAKAHYHAVYSIAFDYGQRHNRELKASSRLALEARVIEHFTIDAKAIGEVAASNLVGNEGSVSTQHHLNNQLPSSFVPGRNLIFLSLAAAKAYSLKISTLLTGVCQTDYSGYPDCRQEFISAAETTISLALDHPMRIMAPLMFVDKAYTVNMMRSRFKSVHWYEFTHTCYEGVWPPCGECPACKLRANGFKQAGIDDPLVTAEKDPLENQKIIR